MHIGWMILVLPLLGSAGLHGHVAAHRRAIDSQVDAIVTVTEVVTEVVTVTADIETSKSAAVELVSESRVPELTSIFNVEPATPTDASKNDTQGFHALKPVGNSVMVRNSCQYPVYISVVGNPTCEGPTVAGKLIEANGTYIETARKCTEGGVSFKLSKDETTTNPIQFEYSIWTERQMLFYDISYLDCMGKEVGSKNLSACVGHERGIQAVGGGDCRAFQCGPGEYCASQGYVVAEFGNLDGAPVGGCALDMGVAFEICAGKYNSGVLGADQRGEQAHFVSTLEVS